MSRGSGIAWMVVSAVVLAALGTGCGSSELAQTGTTSVSPNGISNPALKRIVSGLETRGIIVTSASVVTDSPLKLSVTAISPTGVNVAGFIEPQMEREATAEWVRDPQLSWMDLMVTDAHGKVLTGRGMPLAASNFDPNAVPPAKLDRAQAGDLIVNSIPPLLPSPLKLASIDLRDDVLGARLLYVEVTVPDFEKNVAAYVQAFTTVENRVVELNQTDGTAVGVQCMQAVDEQGRMLVASWYDLQLGIGTNEAGLITDFRPRFFPPPAAQMSTSTSTMSSAGTRNTDSGLSVLTTSTTAAQPDGSPPAELPLEQRRQLDALDAAGVVRTYFETVDFAVVYYLSAPLYQSLMTDPHYVGEQRHEGDISHLVIKGPAAIFLDPQQYSKTDWPIQEQFTVEYDLLVPRQPATEEVGPQIRFVYVGRQAGDSPWKILSVGTGP